MNWSNSLSFDFLIFCMQRSGSHVLAALLDSHPEIVCLGEIGTPIHNTKIEPSASGVGEPVSGKVSGAILKYNRFPILKKNLIHCPKLIHLVREGSDIIREDAIRRVRKNELCKKYGVRKFLWSPEWVKKYWELYDSSPEPSIPESTLSAAKLRYKFLYKKGQLFLSTFPGRVLEVHYEEIDGSTNLIQKMDRKLERPIFRFLGVSEDFRLELGNWRYL